MRDMQHVRNRLQIISRFWSGEFSLLVSSLAARLVSMLGSHQVRRSACIMANKFHKHFLEFIDTEKGPKRDIFVSKTVLECE